MSLNGGLVNENMISESDKDLIDAFIKSKGVQYIQPSGLSGNEACRATNELITKSRRAFRAKMRGKTI